MKSIRIKLKDGQRAIRFDAAGNVIDIESASAVTIVDNERVSDLGWTLNKTQIAKVERLVRHELLSTNRNREHSQKKAFALATEILMRMYPGLDEKVRKRIADRIKGRIQRGAPRRRKLH